MKKHIWFSGNITLDQLNERSEGTLASHLGMQFTELGTDYLRAIMPVDERTHQPYGILHGGASCALAETVGSVASALIIDPQQFICVGMEINANHVRSVRSGHVHAVAKPVHIGSTTHVWDIRMSNDDEQLICISRLTMAILPRKH
jgi:1,4-dihydroxy-2-naphthoyl-CoA hydrolase